IMEDVLHLFVAENKPTQQLAYEDFKHVDQMEMEELEIKWQMAMLTKDQQLGHFARECNVKKVDEKARYFAFKILEVKAKEPKAMAKIEKKEWEVKLTESLARFDKWKESSKNLAKLINSSMSTKTKLGLGFKECIRSDEVFDLSTPSVFDPKPKNREVKSLYERFVKAGEMHKVPPSITGTFMPTSYKSDLEETQETFGSKSNTSSIKTSESNDFDSCDNSDKSSESETYDFASCVSNNIPSVVLKAASVPAGSKNSSPSISTGRSILTASRNRPASIRTGRQIPACRFNKPAPFPAGRSVSTGWTNHAARLFFRPTTLYFDNVSWPGIYDHMSRNEGRWGSAVKSSASCSWRYNRPYMKGGGQEQWWISSIYMVHPHVNKDIGIVDSGCSRNMTGNKEKLADFVQVKGGTVTFGGGDGKITEKGTIRTSKLNFKNVYYVEELQNFNLFFVSQIRDKKNKVLFTDNECLMLTKEFQLPDESQVVLRIPRRHDLYTFNLSDIQPEKHINCLVAKASLEESTKWHKSMAHVNFKTINKLAKNGLVESLPLKLFTNEHKCVACNKGKQHKASYKAIFVVRTISEPLQLLHMDLFGPTSIRRIDQKYYSSVVTNDFSRFSWVFFLGTKDETFYILKDFIALIENYLNKKVKAIRCDNGTKFQNAKLIDLCGEKRIKRDYSNARTPQQNGVAKRKNRTLIEAARSMLADSKLPTMFRTEAVSTACYVLNRVSITNPHNKTPYELMSGKVPNISHLKPFGCQVTILNTSDHLGKFEGKSNEGFLVGNLVLTARDPAGSIVSTGGVSAGSVPAGSIPTSSIPASNVPTSSVLASNVPASSIPAGSVLAGSVPASNVPASNVPASSIPAGGVLAGSVDSAGFGDPAASESVPTVFNPDLADNSILPLGHSLGSSEYSTRFPSPSDLGNHQPQAGIFSSSSYDDDFCADVTNLASSVAVDPVATKRDPDWVAAMQEEMQQFFNQQVWKLVPLPDGKIAIGTKWILKNKRDARDVKSVFLYGEIEEEVYVTQPKGFEDPHNPKHVYRVVKALYGFHQAPKAWYARLSTFLLKHHYRRGTINKTLFLKKDSRHIILVQVYVDDIIFGSTNKAWCDKFEVLMKGKFEMSDMGELTFFLGLQVKQLSDEIFISQDKYVKDMLKKFDMVSVRTTTTPYEVPKLKSKDKPDDAVNVHLYRSMIGSLMYLTASKPDIMFAVSACSGHQVTPMTSHLNAVKKIFKYLKGQPNLGLRYPRDSLLQLEAYSDSDYVRMNAVSSGFLLYFVQIVSRHPMLLVVQVFLLMVLVHADGLVPAVSCTIPTGSYSFMQLDWSHIRYSLTHHPPIIFDSLVKQLWATATVRTHEARPSEIIATIDGNDVVVTESLIRTQLQLNDKTGLYEFTLHDVLDGMREIGYPTDGSLTFYKAKLSPQWRFLIHTLIHFELGWTTYASVGTMLVVPAGEDGADAAAAGAAITNEVPPPPPPPVTPPPDDTPVRDPTPIREPTPVKEPTPSPMREPTTFWEPNPEPPRPSPPPSYPLCLTRQTSFIKDISEDGGGVSLPKSNEAPLTTAATAAGGVEDSVALTDLSLKLDRCINKLGVTKKVLGGAILKLVSRVKRLEGVPQQRKRRMVLSNFEGEEVATKEQEINLDALHELASTKTFTSLAFKHFQEKISAIEDTIPTGDSIPADAQTIPAGSTPIPTTGGVSAGSYMDPTGQASAAAPSSSTIPDADKGKAPMVNDSIPADLLTEQERSASVNNQGWTMKQVKVLSITQLKHEFEYIQWNLERSNLLNFKRITFRPTPTLEAPTAKRARQGVPQVPVDSSQVPASVLAAPSIAADISVYAVSTTTADVSPAPTLLAESVAEVHDENQTTSEQVSAEYTSTNVAFTSGVSHATPSSSRKRRKHIAKKRVTPIVDEILPTPFGSIHAYYDMEEHTKHFTSLRELLHMVEKNDLRRLLGDVDKFYQRLEPETFGLIFWRVYPRPHVHVLETVDGRVIYMFVDVSYPLSEATLERMLRHGLEVPKLLVGGDLTMAEQLVRFIKDALLNAQYAV
nr:putative ribonuclease H-like domain-containing protein [Tanacetum cinerariifolium]